MALAHNKKISMFLEPMLELQGRKGNVKAPTGTLKGEGNALNSSLDNVRSLCKQGRLKEALHILNAMDQRVDNSIYASLLQLCINQKSLSEGKSVHIHMNERGFMADTFLANTLVNMYTKCGSLVDARRVFDDMTKRDAFSWTVMIAAYSKQGFAEEALTLFHQMLRTSIPPNAFTFATILPACANLSALEQGMGIHEEIIRSGYQFDVFLGNSLVDMYAKCGSMKNARHMFDKMPQRDVVSWNTMISAYTRQGQSGDALTLFYQMQRKGIQPNEFTFASVLPACGDLAALEQGMKIHEEIIRSGFQSDIFVGNALVDMYAKCGSLENARSVFDKMPQRDVVSWTEMIAGYALHGHGKEALKLFEQMQHSGTNPDHVTFIGVLSACCHAGLVDEGWQYFHSMSQYYHITPTMEHYGCMVDLLGRAGRLDEAQKFIEKMPIKADATVWGCLLGAFRVNDNIELAEYVAEHLLELDPKNATPYVLLSNIYAAAGRWNDIENVRTMMINRGVKKKPGCSEVNQQVYSFVVGDRSHPQMQEIY